MASEMIFAPLAGGDHTVETLHWYARAAGVVPRAHLEKHPQWWHLTLKVEADGFVFDRMPLTGGDENLQIKLDLQEHVVILAAQGGKVSQISMRDGKTSTEMGDEILAATQAFGMASEYERSKFEDEAQREYDPASAQRYLQIMQNADRIFNIHRSALAGRRSPVQIWPHGFDMSFELFGTRSVEYESGGEKTAYPTQLSLGFSPGEPTHPQPYFYSNPWPYEEDVLKDVRLPEGARWFTEGWKGSILPYAELVQDANAEIRLLDYARAVHEVSRAILSN